MKGDASIQHHISCADIDMDCVAGVHSMPAATTCCSQVYQDRPHQQARHRRMAGPGTSLKPGQAQLLACGNRLMSGSRLSVPAQGTPTCRLAGSPTRRSPLGKKAT